MSTINETYYAVRVGDPRRHKCYLWCGADGNLPVLFIAKQDANEAASHFDHSTPAKAVRVRIKCG